MVLVALGFAELSCGRTGGDKPPEPTPVEGVYWWSGAGVSYREGALGPFTRNSGATAHGTQATIALNGGQFSLVIPACESGVPLSSDPSKPRLLIAENVNCALDDIATALGQTSRVLVGVRVDLDRRSMEQRQCLTYADGSTTCGQSNSSFQPLGEGGAGGAAAIASEGDITRDAVNFADSHLAWRLDNESSVMWECTEVDPAGEGCVAGLPRRQISGIRGALYRMNGGRYYIPGYDCYVTNRYDGEPIRCGQSFDGMADIGIPEAWLYYFDLTGPNLHFEAEMRGKDYKYYVVVKAPVVPM